MRVDQYNNCAINVISSGTKKIGGVSLPDFNKIGYCTKTNAAMSDDRFRQVIIEQAKKDQAAGKFNSIATQQLAKNYISVVSPDRKGLITKGLTQISKELPSKKINYFELLLFGKITYEKREKELTYAEFKDSNGEHIASYSNGDWTFYSTKEEIARESEFFGIYNKAWRNAETSVI